MQLVLQPEYRKLGIAINLKNNAEDDIRKCSESICLNVRATNDGTIKLYENLRYRIVGYLWSY